MVKDTHSVHISLNSTGVNPVVRTLKILMKSLPHQTRLFIGFATFKEQFSFDPANVEPSRT